MKRNGAVMCRFSETWLKRTVKRAVKRERDAPDPTTALGVVFFLASSSLPVLLAHPLAGNAGAPDSPPAPALGPLFFLAERRASWSSGLRETPERVNAVATERCVRR